MEAMIGIVMGLFIVTTMAPLSLLFEGKVAEL